MNPLKIVVVVVVVVVAVVEDYNKNYKNYKTTNIQDTCISRRLTNYLEGAPFPEYEIAS